MTSRPRTKTQVPTRDPAATRNRILKAATEEFAKRGLAGARVDTIAARAKANKGMIYHYFESKDSLFLAVMEKAYYDIRSAERALELDKMEPVAAIICLVTFTWNYYLENPGFITLLNSENLHRAKHIAHSTIIKEMHRPFVALLQSILERGVHIGVFRDGIDPVQLYLTIAAVSYYYFTNRFTASIIFDRDFTAPDMLKERLEFNIETILSIVRRADAPASSRVEQAA